MKREKWISCLMAGMLAFCLSYGAVGCLLTAFDLEESLASAALACGSFSVAGALCWRWKRGDALAACVTALALGYLWRRGLLVSSFETLACEISTRYDGGYGWGILGQKTGTVTLAAAVIGGVIALCTARTVNRQDTAVPALTLALLPLLLCVVVTDTVPAEGCLFWLLLGMILLILTAGIRRSAPEQSNALLAMAAIPVALALGLLFRMVPQEGYVNRMEEYQEQVILWAAQVPEFIESLTEETQLDSVDANRPQTVDLREQGPKRLYTYPVMDVLTQISGTLYLREQDYDSYTGTGWSNTVSRSEEFARNGDLDWRYQGTVTVATRQARHVFCYPYYPGEDLTLEGGCVINPEGLSVYEVEWYTLPSLWRQQVTAEEAGNTERLELPLGTEAALSGNRYRRLPEAAETWAKALLSTILTDEQTATEKADTIAAYVRGSAEYSLDTAKMSDDAEDFAQWFLEESDTGYCVHFATATAVLLRAAGVRSRYVTGYMVWAEAGEVVTVTAAEAHAWVEYYEPSLETWILLESTPTVAGSQGDTPQETEETAETGQTGTGATEATGDTQTVTEEPGQTGESPVGGEDLPQKKVHTGLWAWLAAAALLVAALPLQRQLRISLRRRRERQGGANRQALAMWRETVRLAKLLKRQPPEELEELAQKAKFSQHTLTGQELAVFEHWLRDARRQIRKKPWYLRLVWGLVYAV